MGNFRRPGKLLVEEFLDSGTQGVEVFSIAGAGCRPVRRASTMAPSFACEVQT
jgi:hypothetical protein